MPVVHLRAVLSLLCCLLFLASASCASRVRTRELARHGDEIVIAGRFFHTGAPVVLWLDPGGFDAYRVERRFARPEEASWDASRTAGLESPNRYGPRKFGEPPSASPGDGRRDGDWTLDELQQHVHQFIIHYDAAGTSQACFRVLHDVRGLSCHFLIDLDGTIYQTLDVKERAWHAAHANDRSVGVELANIGAYAPQQSDKVFERWYEPTPTGSRLRAERVSGMRKRSSPHELSPRNPGPISGTIQGQSLLQHDFTNAQYASLAKLTAALNHALPRIAIDYPRDPAGKPVTVTLSPQEQREFCGLLGHYHVSEQKIDPGPAFDWEYIVSAVRRELLEPGTCK